jgi:ABC-type nitrate/sulfonate/bicarbonate transport system substrate-binding protein
MLDNREEQMTTNLRNLGSALAAATIVLLTASGVSALEKVTVILDYPYPVGEHAGFQLAAVKGWHEAAGYDVDIQMGKGSSTTIQQIAAGQGDIGIAQLSAVATTISAGLPVMSVMGLGRVDTYLIHRIVAAIVTTARKF